ncbi:hypothetical protein CCP4SC76_3290002 [Gammaproteobacteria bacterium]
MPKVSPTGVSGDCSKAVRHLLNAEAADSPGKVNALSLEGASSKSRNPVLMVFMVCLICLAVV